MDSEKSRVLVGLALILDVAANHALFCLTNTLDEIPIAPKTVAPQKETPNEADGWSAL
jgi:hypothetical protein